MVLYCTVLPACVTALPPPPVRTPSHLGSGPARAKWRRPHVTSCLLAGRSSPGIVAAGLYDLPPTPCVTSFSPRRRTSPGEAVTLLQLPPTPTRPPSHLAAGPVKLWWRRPRVTSPLPPWCSSSLGEAAATLCDLPPPCMTSFPPGGRTRPGKAAVVVALCNLPPTPPAQQQQPGRSGSRPLCDLPPSRPGTGPSCAKWWWPPTTSLLPPRYSSSPGNLPPAPCVTSFLPSGRRSSQPT